MSTIADGPMGTLMGSLSLLYLKSLIPSLKLFFLRTDSARLNTVSSVSSESAEDDLTPPPPPINDPPGLL